MNYLFIKYLHILCVAVSFALFFIRGVWVLRAYPPDRVVWAKVLPHAIDTLLLLSGIGMVATAGWSLGDEWLAAKLLLIALFIWLGFVALRFGKTRRRRSIAWIGALTLFLFVTTVAMLHNPLGIFSLL